MSDAAAEMIAIDPAGLIMHPGATVTVADPGRLIDAVKRAISRIVE